MGSRILLALVLSLGVSGCAFVRNAPGSRVEEGRRQITELIEDLEQTRSSGALSLREWTESREEILDSASPSRGCRIWSAGSWDEALGMLYAARSASVVHHNPFWSAGGTMTTFFELGFPEGLSGLFLVPFGVAVDLVHLPIFLVVAPIRDLSVDAVDLEQAAADIQRARELGFSEDRAHYSMAWPSFGDRYLDRIGYDAAWLERRETAR